MYKVFAWRKNGGAARFFPDVKIVAVIDGSVKHALPDGDARLTASRDHVHAMAEALCPGNLWDSSTSSG